MMRKQSYWLIGTYAILYIALSACTTVQSQSSSPKDNKPIEYDIRPNKKNGVFRNNDIIGYDVRIINKSYNKQRGTLYVEMFDHKGNSLYNQTIGLSIETRRVFSTDLKLDYGKLDPGFYTVKFIATTNSTKDTIVHVFGLDPEKIYTNLSKPEDFDQFWNEARKDLYKIEPRFRAINRGDLSTIFTNVYAVEMQSMGNQIIRGWLTVPKGRGKYPVIYELPDYFSNFRPDSLRGDVAVFRLDVRGHGNSRDKIYEDYGTLNTLNLNDKSQYIYRDIYMDALRGLDFIYKYSPNLGFDPTKVVISGKGQGAAIAAAVASMDNYRLKGCILESPSYTDMRGLFDANETRAEKKWPVDVFSNYISSSGMSKEDFFYMWQYFDPAVFAPNIKCKVLFAQGLKNDVSPPQQAFALYNQLTNTIKEIYIDPIAVKELDYVYYAYQSNWLKKAFNLAR